MLNESVRSVLVSNGAARFILAISATTLLFSGFATPELPADESALHAGIARRMVQTGHYATPMLYGAPWYEQLPSFLWLLAGSFRIFGFSAGAARFPMLMAGLATIWLTFEIGRKLKDSTTGLIAGIVLTTTVLFWRYAARPGPDIILTAFISGAMLALVVAERQPETRALFWFGVCTALAIFTKAPMGFVPLLILFVAEIAMIRSRRARLLRDEWLYIGLVVGFIIPAIWVTQQWAEFGQAWFNRYVLQLGGEFSFARGEAAQPNLLVLLKALLQTWWPWMLILPMALFPLLEKRRGQNRLELVPIWAWIALVVGTLLLARNLPSYAALPLFPPLAVLIGRGASNWLKAEARRALAHAFVGGLGILTAVGIAITDIPLRDGVLERETADYGAIAPALRERLDSAGKNLAIHDLDPDRSTHALNLFVDLGAPPFLLSDAARAADFLRTGDATRMILASPSAAEALLGRGIEVVAESPGLALVVKTSTIAFRARE